MRKRDLLARNKFLDDAFFDHSVFGVHPAQLELEIGWHRRAART
jgi:hypothetical protein